MNHLNQQDRTCLTQINRGRRILGLAPLGQLPRGIPGNTKHCLIARCFQAHCGATMLSHDAFRPGHPQFNQGATQQLFARAIGGSITSRGDGFVTLSPELQSLRHAFDSGQRPCLVRRDKRTG